MGGVALALGQFVFLACLTRTQSLDVAGVWGLVLALLAPLDMFLRLNGRVVAATAGTHSVLPESLVPRVLTGGVLVIVSVPLGAVIQHRFGLGMSIAWLVAMSKAADGLGDLVQGELQRAGRYKAIARANLLRGGASAATGLMLWVADLRVALVATVGVSLAVLLLVELRGTGLALGQIDRASPVERTWRLLSANSGFGMSSLAVSLGTAIPRAVLSGTHGLTGVAVLTAASYLSVALGRTGLILGSVIAPRLGHLVHEGRLGHGVSTARRWMLFWIASAGIAAVVVGLLGAKSMAFVFGSDYGEGAAVLAILLLAVGCEQAASVGGFLLAAKRRSNTVGRIALCAIGPLVVSAFVAIPPLGILGAALATLVGTGIQAAGVGFAIHSLGDGAR